MSQIELGVVVSEAPEADGRLYVRPNFLPPEGDPILAYVAQLWAGNNFGVRFTPREGDTVVLLYPSDPTNTPIVIASLNSGVNDVRSTVYNPTGTETVQALLANVKDGLEALHPYGDAERERYLAPDSTSNDIEAIKAGRNFTHDIKGADGLSFGAFPAGKSFAAPPYTEFKDEDSDECKEGRQPVHPPETTNRWRSVIRSRVRPEGDYDGQFQEIVLDDNPDSPMMAITARGQRLDHIDGDLHEVVQKDRHTRIVGNDYRYVEGDEYLHIHGDQHVYVNGDLYTTYIGDTYTTNWGTDRVVFYGFDDSIFYGEARSSMYGYTYSYNSGDSKSVSYGDSDSYTEGKTTEFYRGEVVSTFWGGVNENFMGAVNSNSFSVVQENFLGVVVSFALSASFETVIGLKAEALIGGKIEVCLAGQLEVNPTADAEASALETRLTGIETNVGSLRTDVDGVVTRVDTLETSVGNIDTEITAIKSMI